MFYVFDLLSSKRQGKFSVPWQASILGIRNVKKHLYLDLNVTILCEELIDLMCTTSRKPKERLSLRLSVRLVHGLLIVHSNQVKHLHDLLMKTICRVNMPMPLEISDEHVEPEIKERPKSKVRESITFADLRVVDVNAITMAETDAVNGQMLSLIAARERDTFYEEAITGPRSLVPEFPLDDGKIKELTPSLTLIQQQDTRGASASSAPRLTVTDVAAETVPEVSGQLLASTKQQEDVPRPPAMVTPVQDIALPARRPPLRNPTKGLVVIDPTTRRKRKKVDTIFKIVVQLPYVCTQLSVDFVYPMEIGLRPVERVEQQEEPPFSTKATTLIPEATDKPLSFEASIEALGKQEMVVSTARATTRYQPSLEPLIEETEMRKPIRESDDDAIVRILTIVKNWNFDEQRLTIDDLCPLPINRLNIAFTFRLLLELAKKQYLTLRQREGSLELDDVIKGPRFKN